MPPSTNERPHESGAADAAFEASTQVVESLVKAMNLAALYPPGHKSFREAATPLTKALRELLEDGETLRVEVRDETLRIRSVDFELGDGQTKRLHEMLDPIGLACIEIERDATAEDLHACVTLIQKCRRVTDGGSSFQAFESAESQSTVRAVPRKFGQRMSSDGGPRVAAGEALAAIEETMAALARAGIDPSTVSSCKEIVDRMFVGLAERIEDEESNDEPTVTRTRSLDQVLELGVHAMRKALGDVLAQEKRISNPGDLSAALENAIALSTDEDSAQLMLDVLRQVTKDAESKTKIERPPPVPVQFDFEIDLDDLLERVEALPYDGTKTSDLRPEDRSEQLSILLQLLFQFPGQQALEGIRVYLTHCLSGELSADERVVLRDALMDLCTHEDRSLLDRSLPLIAPPLRRSRSEPLPELLLDLLDTAGAPGEALWPHMANELLLGVTAHAPEIEARFAEIVASADAESLSGLVARLRQLEAVRKKRFARRVFDPPCVELFPVLAEIMATPQWPVVGDPILRGLQKDLPTWPGAEVLLRFKKCDDECRTLLIGILRESAIVEASPELSRAAAKILVKSMRFLSDQRRREPWVAQAIESLGDIGYPGATQLLQTVLRERKGVFRPSWPPHCRRAARLALKKLRAIPDEEAA